MQHGAIRVAAAWLKGGLPKAYRP